MSRNIYRKSAKPVVRPKGWPYEDPPPYQQSGSRNNGRGTYSMNSGEVDTVIDHYTKRSDRMENLQKIGSGIFMVLIVVIAISYFIVMDARDEAAQEDCRQSGGEVEPIHNARPYGLEQPWVCARGR